MRAEELAHPGTRVQRVAAELGPLCQGDFGPEVAVRAREVRTFVHTHGSAALERTGSAAHVTASCIVFSPTGSHVLLTHHRKGRFWVQFGGHMETTDSSTHATALRECLEESGLHRVEWFSATPIDAHCHDLPGAFGQCQRHYDVVFAAIAALHSDFTVSAESLNVAWHPVTDLPADIVSDLPPRLPGLWNAVQRLVHN